MVELAHKFIQAEAGGASFERSWSHQKCSQCKAAFTHYYNVEGYADAMRKAGIQESCTL